MLGGELEPKPCGKFGPRFDRSRYGVAVHEIPLCGDRRILWRHSPYKSKTSGRDTPKKGYNRTASCDSSSSSGPEYKSARSRKS